MSPKKVDNIDITDEQAREIRHMDKTLSAIRDIKDSFVDFKLGDIYIREEWYNWSSVKEARVEKTHMGFPIKYKVVHVSAHGIPYLRRLNPNNKPSGPLFIPPSQLMSIMPTVQEHLKNDENKPTARFLSDPEAMDAILLQEDFKPMASHKETLKLFNEINKHNKRVTVKTDWNHFKNIADFFKNMKPGDKFWTSIDKFYILQKLEKGSKEWQITTLDSNQKPATFNFSYFHGRRLYSEQPRSFAREKKT